jgi:hypothetical protein
VTGDIHSGASGHSPDVVAALRVEAGGLADGLIERIRFDLLICGCMEGKLIHAGKSSYHVVVLRPCAFCGGEDFMGAI